LAAGSCRADENARDRRIAAAQLLRAANFEGKAANFEGKSARYLVDSGHAGYLMPPRSNRWEAFTAFLDDGCICLTNNAAERALRGVALGRKSWLFAGSERGGERAAFMYTLIVTAKMNDIDPQDWMADVLARLPNMPVSRVHELLPWNWKVTTEMERVAS
jgi:hypothetical protein